MNPFKRNSIRRWLIATALLSFCFAAYTQVPDDEAVSPKLRPIVSADSKKGWHRFIDGVTMDAAQPEAFFAKYQEAFELADGYGMTLIKHTEEKNLLMHHYRFQQTFNGIPINAAEYILHQREKHPLKGNGNIIAGFAKTEKPAISSETALQLALRQVGAKLYAWQVESLEKMIKNQRGPDATLYPQPVLVYFSASDNPDDLSSYHLAYEIKVFAVEPESHQKFYISAVDGSVLGSYNLLHDTNTPATGTTKYNGVQSFTTDFTGSNYILRETNRAGSGTAISTYDMNNSSDYGMAVNYQNNSTNWQNEPVGVQGHWGLEKSFDYHFNIHGRNSFDDAGTEIIAYLDYRVNYNNAFWNGYFMTFGGGDGVNRTSWASIDVVGHELTHGVTEYTAGLIYANESGALNESFSDIFGTMIEFYGQGNGDWLISEDVTVNGQGIRSMVNPNSFNDPDTYKGSFWEFTTNDNGGVHTNSGVQNFWFYLLSEGGSGTNDIGNSYTVTALGRDIAAGIAYRNLAYYLLPASRYRDAREGALQAAEDLYGRTSTEYAQTAMAWYAVGVGFPVSPGEDIGLRRVIAGGSSCNQLSLELANLSTMTPIPAGAVLTVLVKENGVVKPAEQITLTAQLDPGNLTVVALSQPVSATGGKVDLEIRIDYAPDPQPGNNIVTTKLLRGIMTIGGNGPDFTTIDAALTAVRNPDFILCGNLIFRIRSGLYTGELNIVDLQLPPGSTVTLESETGNADNVTIRSNISVNSAFGTLNIERANGIRVKNLTIIRQASTGLTTANGIAIRGQVNDLVLDGLKVRCLGISGPNRSNIEFQAFGEMQSNIILKNNLLEQANHGILFSLGPHVNSNIVIENNRLLGHQEPMQLHGGNFTLRNNKITSTSLRAVAVFASITGEFRFEGNDLTITNTNTNTSFIGVNISNSSYVKNRNNIINMKGPVAMMGILVGSTSIAEFYHNTIRLEKTGTGTGQVTAIDLSTNVISSAIWNNILVSTISGAIGIRLKGQDILSNGNNLRFPNGFIGMNNSTKYQTIQLWRDATGYDMNSSTGQPLFISDTNLHLSGQQFNLLSVVNTIVKNDIDGELRNSNTPTMGADEYYTPGDLGITAVRLIDQGSSCDLKTVQVDIRNFSVNTPYGAGMQLPVSHTVNGINAVTEVITLQQNLLAGQTITYTFVQRPVFSSTQKSTLLVSINRADANPNNNTFSLGIITKSVYTVGGVNPDFVTIKQGVDFLTLGIRPCVIPQITFRIRPGTYAEPISISELPGTAISLESETGNKADVIMVSSNSATVTLLGAKHVIFKDLTIQYAGFSSANGAMLVKNICEDIMITNCNLTVSAFAGEHYAIKSGPTLSPQLNGFHITNSVFTNGGIRMESNANVNYPFDNVNITGNTFLNAVTHSVFLSRTGTVTVSDNDISSPNVSSGISITQPLKDVRVEKNRIALEAGVNGIYFFNQISSFSRIYVINNFVNVKSGANTVGGIYVNGKGGYIYHNTVRLTNGPVQPTGLVAALSTYNSGIAVRHNIFSSTIANAVGIDWYSGPANVNRNDYHIPNGFTGKQDQQYYTTLADWQAALNLDLQSTDIEPIFMNENDLHLAANQPELRGSSLFPAVPIDIDGEPRYFPPFLGADEFILPPAVPRGLTAIGGLASVTLTWEPNTEISLASYKVYGGPTGMPAALIATVPAPDTTFTHTGLISGQYTYQISAVDTASRESEKSAGVTADVISPPVITSFTPASGPIGTPVTITGNSFHDTANGNVVFFGATRATVTSASATQLIVDVPAGATYQPITVLNNGTTLTGYSLKPFVVTGGTVQGPAFTDSSFEPRVDFTSGPFPLAVATGDLDADGKPDLVVANYSAFTTTATISIYRNTTSMGSITPASFAAKVDFDTETRPNAIAIGDLDMDGKPDLAVTSQSGLISIFRNTSSPGSITASSFAARVNFPLTSIPRAIAIGDLDGDGKPDLAVAVSSMVSVRRNISSTGTITTSSFAAPVLFGTGATCYDVAIGDLDGDDKPELVTANANGSSVSVLRNTAVPNTITNSSFAAKVDFAVSFNPQSVSIGDLDDDAKPDLIAGNRGSNTISVLRNTATAGIINVNSFSPKVDFATGTDPYSAKIVDMNGDGKADLIAGNSGNQTVGVLRNVASGDTITTSSFDAHVDFPASQSVGIAVSDLDGDGKPDMAVVNYGSSYTVSVFRNNMPSLSIQATQAQSNDVYNSALATQSADEAEKEITFFPNPTTGKFFITLPSSDKASISVMDITGRVIKEVISHTSQVTLDLDHVSKGVHLVRIKQQSREKFIRVVIVP